MQKVSGKTQDGYIATGFLLACDPGTNEAIIIDAKNIQHKVIADTLIEYNPVLNIIRD
jgi:hypothetical protein